MPLAARKTDMHTCPKTTGGVPHVGGTISGGFPQVLIEKLDAARVSDLAVCAGPTDILAIGATMVLIGGLPAVRIHDKTVHQGEVSGSCSQVEIGGPTTPATFGAGIILEGTPEEQSVLAALLNKIRISGPQGAAFIQRLETASTPTHFSIADSATQADGTVVPLSQTGGGVTLPPRWSKSGDNEVYVDPTHLINYKTNATGSTAPETPEGLIMHEGGHADLFNSKDPSNANPGDAAEQGVRTLTNPIRQEMGMPAEYP